MKKILKWVFREKWSWLTRKRYERRHSRLKRKEEITTYGESEDLMWLGHWERVIWSESIRVDRLKTSYENYIMHTNEFELFFYLVTNRNP